MSRGGRWSVAGRVGAASATGPERKHSRTPPVKSRGARPTALPHESRRRPSWDCSTRQDRESRRDHHPRHGPRQDRQPRQGQTRPTPPRRREPLAAAIDEDALFDERRSADMSSLTPGERDACGQSGVRYSCAPGAIVRAAGAAAIASRPERGSSVRVRDVTFARARALVSLAVVRCGAYAVDWRRAACVDVWRSRCWLPVCCLFVRCALSLRGRGMLARREWS